MGITIGSGTFSTVEEAGIINGIDCVLKSTPISYCASADARGILKHAFREILALRCLSESSRIVTLVEARSTSSAIHVYLERLDLTLAELIVHADEPLPSSVIQHVARCVADALEECRIARVVHRDVKPSNILLSRSGGVVKLCDFGLARRLSDDAKNQIFTPDVGTLWYKPIEVLLNSTIQSYSFDLWSFGCVIGEIHRLRPLFPGSVSVEQLYLIQDCLGPINTSTWSGYAEMCKDANKIEFDVRGYGLELLVPDIDPCLYNIIAGCLAYNPQERISARKILNLLGPTITDPKDFSDACNKIMNESSL